MSLRLYHPITISKCTKFHAIYNTQCIFPHTLSCHKEVSGLSCLNWILPYSLTRVNNERLILLQALGNTHWETFQVSHRELLSLIMGLVLICLFDCFVFYPSTSFIFKSLRSLGKIQIHMRNHKNGCNSSLRKLLILSWLHNENISKTLFNEGEVILAHTPTCKYIYEHIYTYI